jgi:hypothetical protein
LEAWESVQHDAAILRASGVQPLWEGRLSAPSACCGNPHTSASMISFDLRGRLYKLAGFVPRGHDLLQITMVAKLEG